MVQLSNERSVTFYSNVQFSTLLYTLYFGDMRTHRSLVYSQITISQSVAEKIVYKKDFTLSEFVVFRFIK